MRRKLSLLALVDQLGHVEFQRDRRSVKTLSPGTAEQNTSVTTTVAVETQPIAPFTGQRSGHLSGVEGSPSITRLCSQIGIKAVQGNIFVQIASYRDPQLGATVHDLISKAVHPEQLHIGVCLQMDGADLSSCGPATLPSGPALRGAELTLDVVPSSLSGGVCWARARCQSLWKKEEDFCLQIDSHMRFTERWDQELLACWQRCNDPQAVISVYPNAFELPDICDTAMLPLMAAHHFDENGILRLQGIHRYRYPDELPQGPLDSAVIAAGMLFGPSEMISTVPYDPDLYFYGEEIALSLRLWTHGFNFYNPDRLVMFHLYKQAGLNHITHWADHPDWSSRNTRSIERVLALAKGHILPAPFGLGTRRSLDQYQQWSGIDFSGHHISPDALAGRFSPPPPCSSGTGEWPGLLHGTDGDHSSRP